MMSNKGLVLALSLESNSNKKPENRKTLKWRMLLFELFYLVPMGLGLFTCYVFSWYLFTYGIYTWPGLYVCP